MAKANRRLKSPSSHAQLVSRVAILDVLWSGVSPLAAFYLRDGLIKTPLEVATYCGIAFLVSVLVFQWFQTSSPISRFYSMRDAFELTKACAVIVALSAAATFVVTRLDDAPRSIPILQFLLLATGLLSARVLLRLWSTRRNAHAPASTKKMEHVLLLQASRLAWFFTKMVEELAPGRYQIVAILDEEPRLKHRSLNGYPIIGAPSDLEKIIADYAMHGVQVDKVVLAANPEELTSESREEVERVCQTHGLGFEILPERLISSDTATVVAEAPLVQEVQFDTAAAIPSDLALSRPFWRIKRIIDLVLSGTVAAVTSPLMLVLCLVVGLDVGAPVVFWQRRVGRNGVPIHLYKFRTLQTLFDRQTKERRDAQAPSPIGRFLQRTRLDELPQLWNIISGDMSVIGPRPLLPVDQPEDFAVRLSVRPGLTGWAQVCGGKLITSEEKSALDEWYIRHASLRLDTAIVLRTIWMLLFTGDRRDETQIARALLEAARQSASPPPAVTLNTALECKNEPEGLIARVETVPS